jgi:hypothetical protein
MAGRKDIYTSKIGNLVTMTGADVLTFGTIDFGISIFQNLGILVQCIEVLPYNAAFRELAAVTDAFFWALTNSNALTDIFIDGDPRIYLSGAIAAMGADTTPYQRPIRYDFTNFSGGGVLVPPRPLYWGLDTAGYAAAASSYFRLWYRTVELSQAEYLELVQSVIGAGM